MADRRLVGIDLGITSTHTVRVVAGDGTTVCRRKALPTCESLGELERAALVGTSPGTRLEVVIEPTGPAWLPIAVFFTRHGHTVYRVSSAKAADLRRFLSRHAKSNAIDADTLARLPLLDPASVHALELPGAERAALDRRVRTTDRLTRQGAQHKRRIRDLVRQLMPMSPLVDDLGAADLAVLERWADPNALLKAGGSRLTKVIAKASNNHLGVERAERWLSSARAAVDLYKGHAAVAFTDLAAEVATEVRLLRAVQAELAVHAEERERCYRWVDPISLARSLPGLAEVGGPALVSCMGNADRFPRGPKFRSFTGLAPKASETGDTDRKGQPMSKAGNRLLRTTLVRAAEHARHQDPQLARIYYVQMVERGKDHLGALCVVAANLAERAWAVMSRGMPYVICDTDGTPVSAARAKAIIARDWTVPEDVRRRRRSKKRAGKAPHEVLSGHSMKPDARSVGRRGDLPRPTTSAAGERTVKKPA
jgi:transposase